jgi:four helix bundle protein
MNFGDYKKLIVWQRSMELVQTVYKITALLPSSERYVLVSQMRRSALSIPSNIAEGKRRQSHKEFRRFLNIAFASGAELETQLELLKKLFSIPTNEIEQAESLLDETMRMLNSLTKKQ